MAENHAWIILLANASDDDVGWGCTNFIHEQQVNQNLLS
jgi:hypothetical protein